MQFVERPKAPGFTKLYRSINFSEIPSILPRFGYLSPPPAAIIHTGHIYPPSQLVAARARSHTRTWLLIANSCLVTFAIIVRVKIFILSALSFSVFRESFCPSPAGSSMTIMLAPPLYESDLFDSADVILGPGIDRNSLIYCTAVKYGNRRH